MTVEVPITKEFLANSSPLLFTGNTNTLLANNIASYLRSEVENPCSRFDNDEIRVAIKQNVNRRRIVIIQPGSPHPNESILEILILADAATRGGCQDITAIMPYFPYGRQEKKTRPREPISTRVIADLLNTVKVNRLMTLDLHAIAAQGFFPGPWDDLPGSYVLVPEIKKLNLSNPIVVTTDLGGLKRGEKYSLALGVELSGIYKRRDPETGKSTTLAIMGDVEGKDCVIIDDEVASGRSIVDAANLCLNHGAASAHAAFTHFVATNNCIQDLDKSPLQTVLFTDTIYHPDLVIANHPKFKQVTVAPLIADAICRNSTGQSLSVFYE